MSMDRGEPSIATQILQIDQQPQAPSSEQLNVPANSARATRWSLLVLSIVAVIPFWTVRYPVVTDYPSHLARWFVLFHINDGAYHFGNMYAPAWGPLPYILPDILAMAMQYFLSIDSVGRCLLSLCIILVAYATYSFLKKACPENIGLASFGILVAFNPMFLMGSISYMFSLALCLLVVSSWVSYCRAPKVATAVGIAGGIIFVYLSHLSGFVAAGLAMGVYSLFQEQRWKKLGILASLSLPALLAFVYDARHARTGASFSYAGFTVSDKLEHLIFPVRMYTSEGFDIIFLASLALLVFLTLKKGPKFVFQPVWLAVCVSLILAYFLTPGTYGFGGYIDKRFLPFPYLFFLAVIRFNRVPRRLLVGLVLLVLFRVAAWEQLFISQQPELGQLTASFAAIPRNAKVLPLTRLRTSGVIGMGGLHHLEYGVIQRGFLDPQLFHMPGVQPIRLVGSPYCINAYCDVAGAPEIDWGQVVNSYDYLWVYNAPETKTFASRIGDVVFSNDYVTVYQVRHRQL